METITIRYNDYMELIRGYTMYNSMTMDLKYMLNNTTYDRYDEDVNASSDDMRILFKKYIKDEYDIRLMELKQKEAKENGK